MRTVVVNDDSYSYLNEVCSEIIYLTLKKIIKYLILNGILALDDTSRNHFNLEPIGIVFYDDKNLTSNSNKDSYIANMKYHIENTLYNKLGKSIFGFHDPYDERVEEEEFFGMYLGLESFHVRKIMEELMKYIKVDIVLSAKKNNEQLIESLKHHFKVSTIIIYKLDYPMNDVYISNELDSMKGFKNDYGIEPKLVICKKIIKDEQVIV